MHSKFATVLWVALLPAGLVGQIWQQMLPSVSPSARSGVQMSCSLASDHGMLFGGNDSSGAKLGDTWTFDGSTWTSVVMTPSPTARSGHALAYDSYRGRVVLFGGSTVAGVVNDTWEFDFVNWTQFTPTSSPAARQCHSLAFMPTLQGTVLYGGDDGNSPANYQSDTWVWDGTNWNELYPATRPSPRSGHSLVHDSARQCLVMFGGNYFDIVQSQMVTLGDTWEYDGNTWTSVAPAHTPSPRVNAAMAFDSTIGNALLYGGTSVANPGGEADTWSYDGHDWTLLATTGTPGPQPTAAMLYDLVHDETVLLGSSGSPQQPVTYQFLPQPAPTWAHYGIGCANQPTSPTLEAVTGFLPTLGSLYLWRIDNLPPTSGVAFLTFGVDFDYARGGLLLPLELSPLGLPNGCKLWIGPAEAITVLLPNVGTAVVYGFVIPMNSYLVGMRVGVQALTCDLNLNANDAGMTNGGIVQIH